MPYQRPRPNHRLDQEHRAALLQSYFDHYREAAETDKSVLNRSLPRKAFDELLDRIGSLVLAHSQTVAADPGPVRDFLEANPLPNPLKGLLSDDFRAYCLALKALKQWLAAEQAAADRYLLGGKAQQACLDEATTCVATGEPLTGDEITLHRPVHDGRPPIALSKRGLKGKARLAETKSLISRVRAVRKAARRSDPANRPKLTDMDIKTASTISLVRELCSRDISCVVSIADESGTTFCAATAHDTEKERRRLRQQCKALLAEVGRVDDPQATR